MNSIGLNSQTSSQCSLFSTFALSPRISTYGFLDIVALLCLTVTNEKMTGRQPKLLSDLDFCCDFLVVCTLSWLILKSFFLIGQRNFALYRWTNQRSVFELRSAVATLLCAKNPNSPISHLKLHHQHQSAPFWTKITFWILVRLRDTLRYLVIPTKPLQNQWQIFSYNQTQITGGRIKLG